MVENVKVADIMDWIQSNPGTTGMIGGGLAGAGLGAYQSEKGHRLRGALEGGAGGAIGGGLAGLLIGSDVDMREKVKQVKQRNELEDKKFDFAKGIMDKGEASPREINDFQFGEGDLDKKSPRG